MASQALVTQYLMAWQRDPNDPRVAEQLAGLTYERLKQIAQSRLRSESRSPFSPTELVHEAWLSLKPSGLELRNRNEFFRLFSIVMRNVLIDQARQRMAAKRGGEWLRLTLSAADREQTFASEALMDLDLALDRLAVHYPRHSEVVVLRCFGGLNLSEISDVLTISLATVKRDWVFACAWLADELQPGEDG
ncbi:MAG: ECF-type sigma factor [Xanthomonadales bacterium]|nr:ECF-type sigma factor [Xanthomonadales bacterium]